MKTTTQPETALGPVLTLSSSLIALPKQAVS